MSTRRPWDDHDARTLRALYPHLPTHWVARVLGRTVTTTYQAAVRRGIAKTPEYLASEHACRLRRGDKVGWAHRFAKGHVPANKGKPMSAATRAKCARTMFKPGTLHGRAAQLSKPVGALRIDTKTQCLQRKVTTAGRGGQRWKAVHRLVWESAHGPLPRGHIVVFRPGMKTLAEAEITLDRLELVSHAENMRRNTVHNQPPEIARAMQLRGALNRQINRLSRLDAGQATDAEPTPCPS